MQCYNLQNCIYFCLPGKIFGIHANYIIAEVEFFEGEDPEELLHDDQQQEQSEVCQICASIVILSHWFVEFWNVK